MPFSFVMKRSGLIPDWLFCCNIIVLFDLPLFNWDLRRGELWTDPLAPVPWNLSYSYSGYCRYSYLLSHEYVCLIEIFSKNSLKIIYNHVVHLLSSTTCLVFARFNISYRISKNCTYFAISNALYARALNIKCLKDSLVWRVWYYGKNLGLLQVHVS